jgi:peptidoglycan/xylan/chitin deacetylase (PgdA/CDA1 family)
VTTRRSPFLVGSAVAHVAAGIALAAAPTWWPWLVAGLVADHALIAAAGLVPTCRLLGPNVRRLGTESVARGEVALTFDDGPDPEVTPRVLEMLEAAGAQATFFPVGKRAVAHSEVVAAVTTSGHRLGNHTWSHPAGFWFLPPAGLAREIDRAQQALADIGGASPRWFRAPAGIRSPWLEPQLARRGIGLVSWTRRGFDTVTADPRRVAARLVDGLEAGDVLLLHDRAAMRTRGGRPVVLEVLPRVLDTLAERDLRSVALPA